MSPEEAANNECCSGGYCKVPDKDYSHSKQRHKGMADPPLGVQTYRVILWDGANDVEGLGDFDEVLTLCKEAADAGVRAEAFQGGTLVYVHYPGERIGRCLDAGSIRPSNEKHTNGYEGD